MAEQNVIVRKLPSVETLGCTTVICSDKTGTLTTNKMTAVSLAILTESQDRNDFVLDEYSVDTFAVPYDPKGIISDIVDTSILCNDAEIVAQNNEDIWNGQFKIIGEPTEGSLLVLAEKLGQISYLQSNNVEGVRMIRTECEKKWTRILKLEFDRERKSMSTLCKRKDGKYRLFVKGAPTLVLDRCSHIKLQDGRAVEINSALRQKIERSIMTMSSRPLRCLLLAIKDINGDDVSHTIKLGRNKKNFSAIESNLTMIGLIGIKDPVRDDAKESINVCRKAGIRVIMITGDSKETAVAVGKELDLFAEHKRTDKSQTPTMKAFDGRDFFSKEPIDQVNLLNAGNIVFSRTEPNDKKRIIEILQSLGEIPAMTGDGVNDGTYYAFLCNVHVRLYLRVKEIMNSPCPSTGFYWHSNGLRDRCC